MYKIIVAPMINRKGLDLLARREDIHFEVLEDVSEASLAAAFADADAAIVRSMPVPQWVLENATRLKVVSRHGVGYDNVDVKYLTRRGIPLAITINANAVSVAEQTMFLLLALAKNGIVYDRETRNGNFGIRESVSCRDVIGKRLLILGLGRIGRAVAVRAQAFGLHVMVFDPGISRSLIEEAGYEYADSLHGALPSVDFLSVHLPLTSETRGLIGTPELASMQRSAFVINTARGGIVDEAALATALISQQLRGAALDVFADEPPAPDNPLLSLENVVLSPHSASLTLECSERMAIESVENVLAALDGRLSPEAVVNREVLAT